ncbi:ABC transporter substrate-binding protein [Inquilinus sp.]|jgi:ABC-type nitrate/sulfonate/bicarbonate transport system substrate-binding protein|uniref:ABC transporter substrate-binding protein n=1 Tax=Inquilinus sp. TaxID=1932117 RepID=UPI0037831374
MAHELKIIAFPGAPNLPVFAALEHGHFAAEGLEVAFTATPSSTYQFEAFGAGQFDIAFTAFDNIVAYQEGQGAVALASPPDFRVIMGATQVELSAVVAPTIEHAADLRGKSLALDAVGTGFAFVLYAMLEELGLSMADYERVAVGATPDRWQSVKDGTHAGTITIEPFTSIARAAGFRVLRQSTETFPAYQGGIVAVRQGWAEQNADRVKAFIRGYLKGLDWTLAPENREQAAALLLAKMPEIKPGVVDKVLASVLSPRSGLTPRGEVLRDGMRTVLELRSRYGRPEKSLTDVDKYLALSFHQDAVA